MAGALDLRGRVVITDAGATATLNRIKTALNGVAAAHGRTTVGGFTGNAMQSMMLATDKLQRSIVGLRTTLMGASFAFGALVASTRDFNESKFGYGFARITEFIKDGKLQLEEWKAAMNEASKEARSKAKDLGISPDATMVATEETEKLGFTGAESRIIRDNALGLYMSEPRKLDPGQAAAFLGAIFRSYGEQFEAKARAAGIDPSDTAALEKFKSDYVKGLASKAALAGSSSALGPADTIEGMRQFAPQWAAMGIPYEFALAALAHGSNFGFRAPELGTAYKSLVNKAINPTATGLRLLSNLNIDRSKYLKAAPADPQKAVQRLNSLLDGQLFAGKGGKDRRAEWTRQLRAAYESGDLTSPDFQEQMTRRALKVLGKGWEGRADDVRQAVSNATTVAGGDIDLPSYIKALRDAGATTADLIQIFEGRHIARNTPLFKAYDKMFALFEVLQNADGSLIDAVQEGRKETETGKTDTLLGSIKELMIALEQTGPVQAFKDAIIALTGALSGAPTGILSTFTGSIIAIGAAAGGLAVFATAARIIGGILKPLSWLGGLMGGAAGGAALSRMGLGAGIIGAPILASGKAGGLLSKLPGLVGRLGMRALPFGLALSLGMALLGAGTAYANGGSAEDIAKEGLDGFLGFNLFGGEDGARPEINQSRPQHDNAAGDPYSQSFSFVDNPADQVRREAEQSAADLRASMATLAAAVNESVAMVTAAAHGAASQLRAAASSAAGAAGGVQLNTGPSMRGAN